MKVITSIAILFLSLSVTAIPIHLDGAGTTELSNGPLDFETPGIGPASPFQNIVKRSPIYWQKASELTDDAGEKFPDDFGGNFREDVNLGKLRTFNLALIILVKHLCSRDSKNHPLDIFIAKRMETALQSWRVSITTLRKFRNLDGPLGHEIKSILAEMATARNVLEHHLSTNTLPSPIPAEIVDNLLKSIEVSLSRGSPDQVHIEEVVSHLQQLLKFLQTSNVGARHLIRPKLLTFGDWVGAWDNEAAKEAVGKEIRLCQEKSDEMDRQPQASGDVPKPERLVMMSNTNKSDLRSEIRYLPPLFGAGLSTPAEIAPHRTKVVVTGKGGEEALPLIVDTPSRNDPKNNRSRTNPKLQLSQTTTIVSMEHPHPAAGQFCTISSTQRHSLSYPSMKITISVAFIILSLSALSTTATPIKLDVAASTELSKSPNNVQTFGMRARPFQEIVTRGLELHKTNVEESNLRNLIDEEVVNVKEFRRGNLATFAKDLQSMYRLGRLSEDFAESLRKPLDSRRAEVIKHAARLDAKAKPILADAKSILAEIATCRNMVVNAITITSCYLPHEIHKVLDELEILLPVSEVQDRTQALGSLEELRKELHKLTTISKFAMMYIHAKLQIFGDWVGGWENSAIEESNALTKIKECEDIIAKGDSEGSRLSLDTYLEAQRKTGYHGPVNINGKEGSDKEHSILFQPRAWF
ncbi:hypothetical protein H0H93_005650 [Arthromyces matolae]|nr:hypothetical protein H0H93_005650 [Arthromyces matolae]